MRAQAHSSTSSPSRWLAVAFGALAAAAGTAPAPVAASPGAPDSDVVQCKLPPQIRSLGRNATYLAAGRVVRVPVAECKLRGGSWNGRGPGAYAGAGDERAALPGSIGVTVGGEAGEAACPLKATVAGLRGGSTLSVRSGPATSFARVDRLPNGARVHLCDRSGSAGWVGIVYARNASVDCGLSASITPPRSYSGACSAGWVSSDFLR